MSPEGWGGRQEFRMLGTQPGNILTNCLNLCGLCSCTACTVYSPLCRNIILPIFHINKGVPWIWYWHWALGIRKQVELQEVFPWRQDPPSPLKSQVLGIVLNCWLDWGLESRMVLRFFVSVTRQVVGSFTDDKEHRREIIWGRKGRSGLQFSFGSAEFALPTAHCVGRRLVDIWIHESWLEKKSLEFTDWRNSLTTRRGTCLIINIWNKKRREPRTEQWRYQNLM